MTFSDNRLISLDALRGLTVALMILVNNGGGPEQFAQLSHSVWNGATLCDMVFPFFLFMVGVSIYLAFRKYGFKAGRPVLRKIFKRTLLLFLIGLGINWFAMVCNGNPWDFAHLRYFAVLQRIALCYGLAALFAVSVPHKYTLPTVVGLLAIYSGLLLWGNGYSQDPSLNILSRVDVAIFGQNHLYAYSPVDPEGLLGTIPGLAHTLLGFWCGMLIGKGGTARDKSLMLLFSALVLLAAGFALSFVLPLNKRIWSPSYTLFTCGLAALLLSVLMYLVDDLGWKGWTRPLLVFGTNALFLYVLSELLGIVLGATGAGRAAYNFLESMIAIPKWASLSYAILFVLVCWAFGWPLYRRKIFIKL